MRQIVVVETVFRKFSISTCSVLMFRKFSTIYLNGDFSLDTMFREFSLSTYSVLKFREFSTPSHASSKIY